MASAFEGELDPADEVDYMADFGGDSRPVLEEGEDIASFNIALTAEAAAYGLQIMTGSGRDPVIDGSGQKLIFWLCVDVAEQSNPDFTEGVGLGIEITIVTTSVPARTRQRTFFVTVKQL